MLDIKWILCPIDFSEASRHAVEHAVAIANWYEAQLVIMHVGDGLAPISDSVDVGQEHFEEQVRPWLPRAVDGQPIRDLIFRRGDVREQILQEAALLPADLMVMGTHGRGGFTRLILGSVTERVLRTAGCPLLTVPPPAPSVSCLPYKHVLCPVDFSASSLAALRFALSIAQESDAQLTIQHVSEWPEDEALFVQHFEDMRAVRGRHEAETKQQIEALVPDDVRRWCTPIIKLSYGKASERILETAREDPSDLIVIGIRGRKPLDLMLFGSTTNQVVRHATCPVLTLKNGN